MAGNYCSYMLVGRKGQFEFPVDKGVKVTVTLTANQASLLLPLLMDFMRDTTYGPDAILTKRQKKRLERLAFEDIEGAE